MNGMFFSRYFPCTSSKVFSLLTQPHCRLIVLIPAAVPVILVLGLCLGRFAVDCRGHTGRGGDGDGGGRTSGTLN